MNIYFACSITGGRQDQEIYARIVETMGQLGHYVPTALLASKNIMDLETLVEPIDVYERDTSWIRNCDLMVAEISTPSHGVGYEIGYALSLGKTVLCLYQSNRSVSKMILGNRNEKLSVKKYESSNQAIEILIYYLDKYSKT